MAMRAIMPAEEFEVVRSHFDLPRKFYALGSTAMSCGYFTSPDNDLQTAQGQMLEYTCRKLRVREGERILDLNCGWGAWMLYAATHYRARVFGITSSLQQAQFARDRFRFAGVADRCLVEACDYRDLDPPTEYDKIVSLGISGDSPQAQSTEYFERALSLLMPGGVFLKEVLATLVRGQDSSPSVQRALHNAELPSLSTVVRMAESAGLEVRDIESLREHCALTLDHWLSNLERNAHQSRQIAGDATYRDWYRFIARAAHAIRRGRAGFYQVVLCKSKRGASGFPLTRENWYL